MDREAAVATVEHAIAHREKVQLARLTGSQATYWNGLPVETTSELLLVRTLDGFRLDGFAVLRWQDVTHVSSGDTERFFERVLRSEGALEKLAAPKPIRLDGWQTVLHDVRALYRNAIVECEALAEPLFFLGEIALVDEEGVRLHHIQANGVKEVEPVRIAFDDVTLVRFDEHYLEMFAKYGVSEGMH